MVSFSGAEKLQNEHVARQKCVIHIGRKVSFDVQYRTATFLIYCSLTAPEKNTIRLDV